ncbi:MAG: hypothetical protein IJ876_08390 [Elusimicrobiaceae bacterium]|nr:hypothetical protein [Elusimicrobiaceae bacterium]
MKLLLRVAFFLMIGFTAPSAQAAPWNGYEDDAHMASLLSDALNGHITVRLFLPDSLEPRRAFYQNEIQTGLNDWFTQTAQHISQTARQEEFADIYAQLSKGIKVTFTQELDVPLKVYIVSDQRLARECGNDAGACAFISGMPVRVYIPVFRAKDAVWWRSTVRHELGHTLGLADQYESMLYTDTELAQERGSSRLHETVMSGKESPITCDDADGLINLIDHQQNGARGTRAGKPWHSLCQDSQDWYLNGKLTNPPQGLPVIAQNEGAAPTSPYVVSRDPSSTTWKMRQRNSNMTRIYKVALTSPITSISDVLDAPITVLRNDSYGRPTRAKGKYNEDIYYSYFKEQTMRIALLNDKLIWAEQAMPINGVMSHTVHIGGKNMVTAIAWYRDKNNQEGQAIAYVEHREQPQEKWLRMEINCQTTDMSSCSVDTTTRQGQHSLWLDGFVSPANNQAKAQSKQSSDEPSSGQSNRNKLEQRIEQQTHNGMMRGILLHILGTRPLETTPDF